MKKIILLFLLIILSLAYYLGFPARKETLPLSREFFSTGTSSAAEQTLDLKRLGAVQKLAEGKPLSLERKDLDQLHQLKLDKGIRNLPILSLSLIRDAKRAREAGDPDRAVELADYAVRLSPDLPRPYYELAWALWKQSPLQPGRILPEILKGCQAAFRHYPTSLNLFYHFFYILFNAILMAFLIFGIVILWRHARLYFSDIRRNLTQEVSVLFVNGLKVFILLLPFFLRLDLLWAILFWSVILWGYLGNRERQFVVVFLIVLVYLPFFLRTASSFLDGAASEIILEMHKANHENWERSTEDTLKAWALSKTDDPEVLFTLGLIEKKKTRYSQAEDFYRRAIDRDPNMSEAFSNLGNVYLAQKQIPAAIDAYQRAVDLRPEKGAYHYNLYRAYSQETFLSGKSDKAFEKARKLAPALVQYYSKIDSSNINRMVIDETLMAGMLWNRFLNQFIGKEGLLFRLFKAWFERIPSAVPLLAPILFLALIIGMSRYTRSKRFLTRCPMCGSGTHRFYLSAENTPDQKFICFNCFRLFVQREKLHPKISQKKALQAAQFQKQDFLTGKILSYFLIGFGDLWRGHPLKGLFFLSVFFVFVLRFLFWNGILPDSGFGAFSPRGVLFVWGGFFLLFYFLSLRRVRRQKPQFEIPK